MKFAGPLLSREAIARVDMDMCCSSIEAEKLPDQHCNANNANNKLQGGLLAFDEHSNRDLHTFFAAAAQQLFVAANISTPLLQLFPL
jgi:hypothetical protein